MVKKLLLALVLLAAATPALAQVHPCDVPAPANPVPVKANRASWCAKANDEDGIPLASFNFRIYVNATVRATWTNASPTGAASATGWLLFETSLPGGIGRGIHQVNVGQFNEIGDSQISNTALWQIGGKPVTPTNTVVKQ